MPFVRCKELCDACWNNKHEFILIDKDCKIHRDSYRKGFDSFINLNQKMRLSKMEM